MDWLNDLYATTIDGYSSELVDNIFTENVLLDQIKKTSKVVALDGGLTWKVDLLFGAASGMVNYGYYDKINITPSGGIRQGSVSKARYAIPIAISNQELEENTGKPQIVNLLEAKIMQAENTLMEGINDQLWGINAITKTSNGVALISLPEMVAPGLTDALPLFNTAFMGLNPATAGNEVWKNQAIVNASIMTGLGKLKRLCTDGVNMPNIIITNDLGTESYEALLQAQSGGADVGIRYNTNAKGDVAYASLSYGGIPMVSDKSCPVVQTGKPVYYMLNTKYLGFKLDGIRQKPFEEPGDQDARSSIMFAKAQFFTNNRRYQGVFKNIA